MMRLEGEKDLLGQGEKESPGFMSQYSLHNITSELCS